MRFFDKKWVKNTVDNVVIIQPLAVFRGLGGILRYSGPKSTVDNTPPSFFCGDSQSEPLHGSIFDYAPSVPSLRIDAGWFCPRVLPGSYYVVFHR